MPECHYGNAPPPPPTQQAILNDLSHVLDNATRCSTFTCGGNLPILTEPSRDESGKLTPRTEEKVQDQRVLTKGLTLRWGADGHGRMLTLPINDTQGISALHLLLKDCTPATFGLSGKDVYDESYRRAVALNANAFMTDFCPYEAGIIDIVTQFLLPPIIGDLEPEPPRSKVESIDGISREQGIQIYDVIFQLPRNNRAEIDTRDIETCLTVLDIGPVSAQEMLKILGKLDPQGTGFVLKGKLVDFMAKRIRWKNLKMNPETSDRWQKWRRMVTRRARAELYKLNVYSGPSGLFKPHVDTPRSEIQIGSLVVCLPVEFESGTLAVRHQQEEVVYDWSKFQSNEQGPSVHWAAFYSDCEHEVLEVTSGYRVTLTYNLFLAPGTSILTSRPTSLDREQLPLVANLKTMLSNAKFMPDGGYIGIHLTHQYPHTHEKVSQFISSMRKGVDMVLYESIALLNLHAIVCPVSKTNLPPCGIVDALDKMEHDAARKTSTVVNGLATFEADFDDHRSEEDCADEKDALEEVEEYFNFDTDSEGSQAWPEVSNKLKQWKGRFDDREAISWVNQARHEEVSRVYMAVSLCCDYQQFLRHH